MSADVAAEYTANTDSTFAILRRGLALTPQVRAGLAGTIGLAAIGTIGKVAIPIAIQQGIDRGPVGRRWPQYASADRDRRYHGPRAVHHALLHVPDERSALHRE